MPFDPRHRSHVLVDGPERAPARSYFRSIGFSGEDLRRPLVMVAHSWIGTMPCNFSHRELAQATMAGGAGGRRHTDGGQYDSRSATGSRWARRA